MHAGNAIDDYGMRLFISHYWYYYRWVFCDAGDSLYSCDIILFAILPLPAFVRKFYDTIYHCLHYTPFASFSVMGNYILLPQWTVDDGSGDGRYFVLFTLLEVFDADAVPFKHFLFWWNSADLLHGTFWVTTMWWATVFWYTVDITCSLESVLLHADVLRYLSLFLWKSDLGMRAMINSVLFIWWHLLFCSVLFYRWWWFVHFILLLLWLEVMPVHHLFDTDSVEAVVTALFWLFTLLMRYYFIHCSVHSFLRVLSHSLIVHSSITTGTCRGLFCLFKTFFRWWWLWAYGNSITLFWKSVLQWWWWYLFILWCSDTDVHWPFRIPLFRLFLLRGILQIPFCSSWYISILVQLYVVLHIRLHFLVHFVYLILFCVLRYATLDTWNRLFRLEWWRHFIWNYTFVLLLHWSGDCFRWLHCYH